MRAADVVDSLPPPLRKHLDPSAPLPARMMAAKGMVPLPPREMVIVMSGLSLDDDENVASAARESLRAAAGKDPAAGLGRWASPDRAGHVGRGVGRT